MEGCKVGRMVGDLDGGNVGALVGGKVGNFVGDVEGDGVGCLVGTAAIWI